MRTTPNGKQESAEEKKNSLNQFPAVLVYSWFKLDQLTSLGWFEVWKEKKRKEKHEWKIKVRKI